MGSGQIRLIKVKGTHREVGQQIGQELRPQLEDTVERVRSKLPAGRERDQMLHQGQLCLAQSRLVYPQYVEELEGVAEGAGLSFQDVFLGICELWEMPGCQAGRPAAWWGCTDFAARGAATADGATLIAHNNDTSEGNEDRLSIIQAQAGDEPEFLGVSVRGIGFSVGFNAAGICLSGNNLCAWDVRPGVPRLLLVRAILGAERIGEALAACLLPERAANYNNVVADANGEVYSMEGSATDCEPIYMEDDVLVHSNHYVTPAMRRFEADRNAIANSIFRYYRGRRLLRENHGRLSVELLRKILADHVNYPESICKHQGRTVTEFSFIVNLNELRAWIGSGRPCETTYGEYRLEPWTPPADWPRR